MRKFTAPFLKIGLIVFLSAYLAGTCEAQTAGAADAFVALVLRVKPPTLVQRNQSRQTVPLQQNDRLYPGDRVICGDGGQASIIFGDTAVEIKLTANSELIFQGQRTSDGITKRIFLQMGRMLTQVFRKDMEVVTPTCVASVKGTKWWTTVDRSQQTQVIVLEGEVRVENPISGIVEMVSAGNTATCDQTGSLKVAKTSSSEIPEESPGSQQGSLDIKFEDGSGQSRTLHIEFDR
jgi:hypothetical protein